MALHSSKRTALIQLINCIHSDVQDIKQLSDGKIFCDIIKIILPERPQCGLSAQDGENVSHKEELKDEQLQDSVNNEPDGDKMDCDLEIESDSVIKKESEIIDESGIELMKSAVNDNECTVTPTKPADECVIETTKSVNRDGESVTAETVSKPDKSLSDSESPTKPHISLDGDSKSVTDPVVSSNNDISRDDISQRYKFIQSFINEIYELKSEKVISFPLCRKANEYELAKVVIFILSEIIRYYVLVNNDAVHTLSLLDIKVQQDLEQCFKLCITDRDKITKENVCKLLNGPAPFASPSRSYFTPPRTCPSRYRTVSPASSQENIFTDSPLKKYFESPNFTKADIIMKEKEILKTKESLFKEELRSEDFQQEVQDLESKLKTKDIEIRHLKSEISSLKVDNQMLAARKSETCEDCKMKDKERKALLKEIQQLKESIKETSDQPQLHKELSLKWKKKTSEEADVKETTPEKYDEYEKKLAQLHIQLSLARMHANCAEDKACRLEDEVEKSRAQVFNLELEVKELKEEIERKRYMDQRTDVNAGNRRLESPEHDEGEIIGNYIVEQEENEKLCNKMLQQEEHPEVKHVMVQCPEQHIDYFGKSESNVPDFLSPIDLPEDKKFLNLKNSTKCANEECSNMRDVSSKLDTISRYVADSPNTVVSLSRNMNTPLTIDSSSVLSNECNSSPSDNENADKVPLSDNSSHTKFLNMLEKILSEMMHHPAVLKALSGPNGSNNGFFNVSHVTELKEYLNSVRKNLCLSQTAESQNNNSISKNIMINETECCGSQKSEISPNKKVRNDNPNSNIITPNHEYYDVLKKEQIDSLKNDLKIKQEEVYILNERRENMEKKLLKKEKEIISYKKVIKKRQEEIRNLEKELEDVNISKKKFQEEQEKTEKQLRENQETINNLSQELERVKDLNKSLSKKEENFDNLKNSLEEEEKKCNDLKNSLGEEQEKCNALKKKLKEKQEEYNTLKRELEEKQQECNTLKRRLEEKQEECNTLKKGLEEKQKEMDSMNKECEEKEQKMENLKKQFKEISGKLNLKERELKAFSKKYSKVVTECAERVKVIELRNQNTQRQMKEIKQKYNSMKNARNIEYSSLQMNVAAAYKSQAKTAAELSACLNKLKNMEDENEKLHKTVENLLKAKKEMDEEKKVLEPNLEYTSSLAKSLPKTVNTEISFLGMKGIKDEYVPLEITDEVFSKSNYISSSSKEVTSMDAGNESTLSCALYNRSLQSGFTFFNDDEEAFLNHSSIAEINKDYESADVQEHLRRQELKRRNTMCASHLQSTYATEGIFLTPVDKRLPNSKNYKKYEEPENHLDKNEHAKKKRKISEIEAESQSNKLLTTPAGKVKRTFKTPSSLHKLLQLRRNRRLGSIKPIP